MGGSTAWLPQKIDIVPLHDGQGLRMRLAYKKEPKVAALDMVRFSRGQLINRVLGLVY